MINYSYINDSINHYAGAGYVRVETPWVVSEDIINITKPKEAEPYKIEHTGKCLVGSAEQSFLYQYLKGALPPGKFQSVTPCFRDEQFDRFHTKYFIKNELINTKDVTTEELDKMVHTAKEFFFLYTDKVSIEVNLDGSYDIYINDIEVGSYGIRQTEFIRYIYGTACAEPRLTMALRQKQWDIIK